MVVYISVRLVGSWTDLSILSSQLFGHVSARSGGMDPFK